MKIIVLGASGMLGSMVFRVLNEQTDLQVYGTVRSGNAIQFFHPTKENRLISGIDVEKTDSLIRVFSQIRPDVAINCIGLVKQLAIADDPLLAIPINSQLPHRLARMCELVGARLIHISTDCVFSGEKGGYVESDPADAQDLYGKTKSIGEVDYPYAVTLRTSIIGHELQTKHGLVEWFLSQESTCDGYTKAIFSGFPTVVLAQIIKDYVLSITELSGIYHVASDPISKYDLLQLMAKIYRKKIKITPNESLVMDRSLDASRFINATGYLAPEWESMIELMHKYQ